MVPVEARGRIILGVDDEGEDGRLGSDGAGDGIDEQCAAEPATAISLIDGEPADQPGRQDRVTGQASGLLGQQFADGYGGRSKGVVAGTDAGAVERCEAIADPAPHILGRKLPQIAVERVAAAGKLCAIVAGPQRLDRENPSLTARP